MSDGTSTLYFLDADTFQISDHIQVHDNGKPINNLNELEFIDGQIYANIWGSENIAIIDSQDGRVTGWIDISEFCHLNLTVNQWMSLMVSRMTPQMAVYL